MTKQTTPSGQSTDAAERSAHVTRGAAPAQPQGPDPFSGPEFGPLRIRAVADLLDVIARLETERAGLRLALGLNPSKE